MEIKNVRITIRKIVRKWVTFKQLDEELAHHKYKILLYNYNNQSTMLYDISVRKDK